MNIFHTVNLLYSCSFFSLISKFKKGNINRDFIVYVYECKKINKERVKYVRRGSDCRVVFARKSFVGTCVTCHVLVGYSLKIKFYQKLGNKIQVFF